MFESLKAYFLAPETKALRTVREFFENDLNESNFWAVHSFMTIFQNCFKGTEKADVSVNKVLENSTEIMGSTNARVEQIFCLLKVASILRKVGEDCE